MPACRHLPAPRSRESASPRSCKKRNRSSFSSRGLIAGAWYLIERSILQPQRGQPAAPYAPGVEGRKPVSKLQAKCRPMAAEDGFLLVRSGRVPRDIARRRGNAFGVKLHAALARAKAHARHRVDYGAQPVPAGEPIAPFSRGAAIHVGDEFAVIRRG